VSFPPRPAPLPFCCLTSDSRPPSAQMDESTPSIWQTAECSSCHPLKVSPNDRTRRVCTELARERDTPNEQCSSFSLQPSFSPLPSETGGPIHRCHTRNSLKRLLVQSPSSSSKRSLFFIFYVISVPWHVSNGGRVHRYVSSTGRATAEDASQIFGGRSITQSGMGKLIENVGRRLLHTQFTFPSWILKKRTFLTQYHRTSPYDAILGGSEDVLGDLGVRQAFKKMPRNARL
jgi:hypothetical protein